MFIPYRQYLAKMYKYQGMDQLLHTMLACTTHFSAVCYEVTSAPQKKFGRKNFNKRRFPDSIKY